MIELGALILACAPAIHQTTMQAVVTHESARNPYAIGVNRAEPLPRQPRSKAEAVAIAKRLQEAGASWDGGLAQINNANLEWLDMSIEDVFDPCKNLQAAQRVLAECYARALREHEPGQAALAAALSCYNTGDLERGVANGYVHKVRAKVPALEPLAASASQSGRKRYSSPLR